MTMANLNYQKSGLTEAQKALFLKVNSGEASADERRAYAQLKMAGGAIRDELQSMEEKWQRLFEYPIELDAELDIKESERTNRSLWAGIAVAACLVVTFVVLMFSNLNESPIYYQMSYNQQGSQVLSDHSTVHMNASSSIEVAFNKEQRKVLLKKGEALFDVSKDPNRKFVVETEMGYVQAIGTSFNVNLLSNHMVVTIVEGTVMVRTPEDASGETGRSVVATANQRVRINADDQLIVEDLEDTSQSIAWREGKLIFAGEQLYEALEMASRHSSRSISILDSRLKKLPVYGVFNSGDITSLLAALESSYPQLVVTEGRDAFYISYRQPKENHINHQ